MANKLAIVALAAAAVAAAPALAQEAPSPSPGSQYDIATAAEFIEALKESVPEEECPVPALTINPALYGTAASFSVEVPVAETPINDLVGAAWLSDFVTLSQFVNEQCCQESVESLTACACLITRDVGFFMPNQTGTLSGGDLAYYVFPTAGLTNRTNEACLPDGDPAKCEEDGLQLISPTWDNLLGESESWGGYPTTFADVLGDAVPSCVPTEEVKDALRALGGADAWQTFQDANVETFEYFGCNVTDTNTRNPCRDGTPDSDSPGTFVELLEQSDEYSVASLCDDAAVARIYLARFFDAQKFFLGTGFTPNNAREFIVVPNLLFGEMPQTSFQSLEHLNLGLPASGDVECPLPALDPANAP
jgi:hypothetical protein